MVQRIERAFALLGASFAEAGAHLGCGAAKEPAGGGWATFLGNGSQLTHVVGTDGQLTGEQLKAIEEFFFSRGADSVIEVADVWQLEPWLTSHGYELSGSEQVLEAEPGQDDGPVEGVIDCSERLDEWALAVQMGFGMEPTPGGQLLGRILGSHTPLGVIRDGQIAASAAHAVIGDIGYCYADSTLPAFRGLGLQQQLIAHRRWLTAQAGGHYCVAETAPGSASERNYRRCGFVPAFVRQTFAKRLMVSDTAIGKA